MSVIPVMFLYSSSDILLVYIRCSGSLLNTYERFTVINDTGPVKLRVKHASPVLLPQAKHQNYQITHSIFQKN